MSLKHTIKKENTFRKNAEQFPIWQKKSKKVEIMVAKSSTNLA
jgi:hypothetical protein